MLRYETEDETWSGDEASWRKQWLETATGCPIPYVLAGDQIAERLSTEGLFGAMIDIGVWRWMDSVDWHIDHVTGTGIPLFYNVLTYFPDYNQGGQLLLRHLDAIDDVYLFEPTDGSAIVLNSGDHRAQHKLIAPETKGRRVLINIGFERLA